MSPKKKPVEPKPEPIINLRYNLNHWGGMRDFLAYCAKYDLVLIWTDLDREVSIEDTYERFPFTLKVFRDVQRFIDYAEGLIEGERLHKLRTPH